MGALAGVGSDAKCNFFVIFVIFIRLFFVSSCATTAIECGAVNIFVISVIDLFYLLDCFVNFIAQCFFGNTILCFFVHFGISFYFSVFLPYLLPVRNAWCVVFRVPLLSCVACAAKLHEIHVTVARHLVSFLFFLYLRTYLGICTCQLLILWLAFVVAPEYSLCAQHIVSKYVCTIHITTPPPLPLLRVRLLCPYSALFVLCCTLIRIAIN